MNIKNIIQSKKKVFFIVVLLLFSCIFLYFQYKKILTPFSLVSINSINLEEYSLNESRDFFNVKLTINDKKIIGEYIKNNFNYNKSNDIENIRNIVKLTRELLKHNTSSYIRKHDFYNIQDIINNSGDYSAICSGYAKLFVILSNNIGYTSRVLWLHGHVVSETFIPSLGKWIYIDSDRNVLIKSDNYYLNLGEFLQSNNYQLEKIVNFNSNDYDILDGIGGDTNSYTQFLKLRDKVILLSGKSLLTYSHNASDYKKIFLAYLGFEPLGFGVQLSLENNLYIGNKDIINQIKNLLQ